MMNTDHGEQLDVDRVSTRAGAARLPRVVENWQKAGIAALWASIILFALVSDNRFALYLAALGCIYGVLLMSQNLVTGYMGLLHLAQAAFFGLGAYTSAVLSTEHVVPVLVAYLLGTLVAALGGAIVGGLSIRFGGHYLAIVSLGFGIIVYQVITNWVSVTQGPLGLRGIPSPPDIGPIEWSTKTHLVVAATVMSLVLLLLIALRRSKLGMFMDAVRADVIAAQSLGINTTKVKIVGYTITAGLAGLAGVLFAHFQGILAPDSFTFLESATILAMTVLGGMRSYLGSIAGAFFMVVVPELLRGFSDYRLMIYGALLVFVVLFFPKGLAGVGQLALRGLQAGRTLASRTTGGSGGSVAKREDAADGGDPN